MPETDEDRSSGRLRQCALSRTPLPVEALVRFVLSPDGVVTPDTRCKLPGRGLWLRAQRQTIAEALRRKLFPRGFRSEAQASADLVETVERLLRQDALNALSLANKTGSVITGYEKIKDAIAKRRIEWLLHALDAAESGCNRLDRQFAPYDAGGETGRPGSKEPGLLVLPRLFTAVELSLALGRENVIHVGLKRGEAARRFRLAWLKAVAFGEPAGVDAGKSAFPPNQSGSTHQTGGVS